MDSIQLSAVPYLTQTQKTALKKGTLQTVADLLLVSPQDIGRRCRISPLEAKSIFTVVCQNNPPQIRPLADIVDEQEQICSTGDSYLDAALGGGVRTGMVWEVFGQSAAGKTQMALQLSLLVQIPVNLGGLSGSACYITISSKLPTSRLLQIVEAHPLLSKEICGLENINTIKSPTIPILLHVLSKILPDLITKKATEPNSKPVKLVVIDALAELFHADDKTTTSTLVDRSHNVVEVSTLLHSLASSHNLAVLVLNEVSDVFNRDDPAEANSAGDLGYKQQSRWFGGADSVSGEANKEASLGLVWANQVNTRIMFSRTGRRRHLEDSFSSKRPKANGGQSSGGNEIALDDEAVLVRRMSIIFSSVAAPCSLDYIVTAAGISVLPDEDIILSPENTFPPSQPEPEDDIFSTNPDGIFPTNAMSSSQVAPLDAGLAEHDAQSETRRDEDEEWENYWNADDMSGDIYNSVALDGEEI
ncbi:P-loop containing nucleoside triphosphate hydrolase protein [Mycena metata]|uniref:P-loop containing nucleoside triphosphate hydrolase protein n=1 Tax=Mycena metata TaxID=1033252 RepID=A0AAD7NA36_9AGAR|nr:P-loop containing nucleoside triphosphate hydrolase protein [Mycena metata]